FESALSRMLDFAGQGGCPSSEPLEASYRFLVDPVPYEELAVDEGGRLWPGGEDEVLLAQRDGFLRQSSLLRILMISDANDCSANATEEGQSLRRNASKVGCFDAESRSDVLYPVSRYVEGFTSNTLTGSDGSV